MNNPKILIVNDNASTLSAYKSILDDLAEAEDFEILTANSGAQALRMVLQHEFAVVLLDVNMPIMNGFETAEIIHSNPRLTSLPIIFVTAHFADEMNRLRGYEKGAADYIFTPIMPTILKAKVAVFVNLAREKLSLQRQKEELSTLNRELQLQRIRELESLDLDLQKENVERRLAEQRAQEISMRDPLTGLLNRRPLIEHVEHAIACCARYHHQFALLFVDLDRFKAVNDSHGHNIGDEVLVQAAERIADSVREADIVARLGGDEFVVLLKRIVIPADASKVADKTATAIAQPFDTSAGQLRISASIGAAVYPQDGTTAQALLKASDAAMYGAKHRRTERKEISR